ncbi:hypothetical protein CEXT_587041, partial [Caerostris extrusa]
SRNIIGDLIVVGTGSAHHHWTMAAAIKHADWMSTHQ